MKHSNRQNLIAPSIQDEKKNNDQIYAQANLLQSIVCHNSTDKKLNPNEQETNPNSAVQSSQSTIKLHLLSEAQTVIYHKHLQDESMRLFTFMNSSQKDGPCFLDQVGNFNQNLKNQIQSKNLMDKHPESIIQLIEASRRKRQKFLNQISLDLDLKFELDLQKLNGQQVGKNCNFGKSNVSKSTKHSKKNQIHYETIQKQDYNKLGSRRASLTPKIFKANQKNNNCKLFRAKSTLSNLKIIKKQNIQETNNLLTPSNNSVKTPKSKNNKVSMFLKEQNQPSNVFKKQSKSNLNVKANSNDKFASSIKQVKSSKQTKEKERHDNHKKIDSTNVKDLVRKKKQLQRQLLQINQNILFKKKTKAYKIQETYRRTNVSKNGSFLTKKQQNKN